MTNELMIRGATTPLNYSDSELLKTLKSTICPEATPEEFKMFLEFCKGTGLNPFKKEIWFIKTKGKRFKADDGTWKQGADKVQMMTGINGFYAIANSHPQYDGMEEISIETDGVKVLRATAKVWRKDRRFPSVGVAEWSEYAPEKNQYNGNSIWFTKPRMMLSKVAESIALRKAFPNELNGLYTQEEMPQEFASKENDTPKLKELDDAYNKRMAEVAHKESIPVVLQSGDEIVNESTGEIGSLEFKYALPKAEHALRLKLKSKGFTWNPDKFYWSGFEPVEEAEKYRVGVKKEPELWADEDDNPAFLE